ncbi:MAG: lysophospholipid acyltransferase family protein [Porphyromonadaceae bacterium]|nr:lysophospholipid acyltransferase family protein [Porphyromonadaceae bacterium]
MKCLLLRILFLLYYIPIGLPLFVLVTAVLSGSIVVGCLLGYGAWSSRYLGKIWARVVLILHCSPVSVSGREYLSEEGGVYVVVANHQSAFDIYALYGYIDLPFKWVLKEELRRMPFVGWACEAAGFIFVDDKRPSSINQTLSDANKALLEGSSIFIFPEGSRTLTGQMMRFKKGAFVMASQLGVPVLPVSIDGAFDVLKRGDKLAYPHRIKLTIHPPIDPKTFGEPPRSIMLLAAEAQRVVGSVLPREPEGRWTK